MIIFDINQIVINRYHMWSLRNDKPENFPEGFDVSELEVHIIDYISKIHWQYGSVYGDVVLAGDGGGRSWRRDIFEHYKASRPKKKKSSSMNWDFIHEFINEFMFKAKSFLKVYYERGIEADDIIARLVLTNPDEKHLIVSMDKDFFQLHNENVFQYMPTTKKLVSYGNGKKILKEHIIRGDEIDGIPNILSDGDTFVINTKRQRPMRTDRLDKYMRMDEGNLDEEVSENFQRNKQLISLYDMPESIVERIDNLIKEEK